MKVNYLQNNIIFFIEFIRAIIDKNKLLSEKNLKIAFKLFDHDNSDSITARELKSILGLSAKYSDKVWDEILNEIEHNKENELTYLEFHKMMSKLINQ
jgi:Ca2+-binding EF-hand superfamily protein